jgi:hypothetical protein
VLLRGEGRIGWEDLSFWAGYQTCRLRRLLSGTEGDYGMRSKNCGLGHMRNDVCLSVD